VGSPHYLPVGRIGFLKVAIQIRDRHPGRRIFKRLPDSIFANIGYEFDFFLHLWARHGSCTMQFTVGNLDAGGEPESIR
jgi:hypothetical protein